MNLTDSEAQDLYSRLIGILRGEQLDWVVTQVEEQIALGKIHTKRLKSKKVRPAHRALWADEEYVIEQSRKPAAFTVSEAFTPQEQLLLLLDGLEQAVPVLREIVDQTFDNFAQFGTEPHFLFQPEGEVKQVFRLDQPEVRARTDAAVRLRDLIDELRDGGTHTDEVRPVS